MSDLWQSQYRQKRSQSPRATAISLQSLWGPPGAGISARSKKKDKSPILKAYQERVSLRGLTRIFGVARPQIAAWIREHTQTLPPRQATLLPWQSGDVLEGDEAWSFVRTKVNQCGLWTVMCRRTRQMVAFALGDRPYKTCPRLWNRIPWPYRYGLTFTDFWESWQKVVPEPQHVPVGKESGATNHMERWYNSLRQRLSRFVRKTLSFSKSEAFHHMVVKWFITEYNLQNFHFWSSLTS
jgi:insertion element IS1 protein InsB